MRQAFPLCGRGQDNYVEFMLQRNGGRPKNSEILSRLEPVEHGGIFDFLYVPFDVCCTQWTASSFGDCRLMILLLSRASYTRRKRQDYTNTFSYYHTCRCVDDNLTRSNTVYHFCHFFYFFYIFSSLCSLSMITTGHFGAALPFNESFHCLVDNRMNEWLSVLVAATAYPIR